MKLFQAFYALALLIATLVVASAAFGQQPVTGGTLYSLAPGPVTMTLLSERVPPSVNWFLPMFWRTGPGIFDYGSTGGNVATCTGTQCDLTPVNLAGQFGRHNNVPGTTITSPSLPAGQHMYFLVGAFSVPRPARPDNARQLDLVHTPGMPQGFLFLREPMNRGLVTNPPGPAAVFPGRDGTARIGFNFSASAPFSSNFLDYPIQILVGNVCVR